MQEENTLGRMVVASIYGCATRGWMFLPSKRVSKARPWVDDHGLTYLKTLLLLSS